MEYLANLRSISAWYVFTLCILFTLLSIYLIGLYSLVHWGIWNNSHMFERHMETLENNNELKNHYIKVTDTNEAYFEWMVSASRELSIKSETLLQRLAFFRLTGLISFLLSILTFFYRPKRVGFYALPFGLLGGLMGLILI
jgi:hypothetical protein